MPAENKIQTQSEAEEKMVDLPDTGSAVDVEIAETKKTVNPDDDTPAVETEVETASSEEMDDYGQKVQTRIDKLTKRLREAERREQAAVQYAQGVQKEAQQQAARSNQLDTGYVTEFADRVEAQSKISRLSIEQERAASHKAQRERLQQEMQAQGIDPNQPQMPQQPMPRQPAPPRQPDPKAQKWAEKNEWFGTDEPMTLTSFSIHRKLMEEGFDAQSDSYYNEVDKRMRETFPHKFEQQVSPSQTVASANRAAPGKARKGSVRLTPSQVAIAKKLGVPLQEYAKYVKE